MHKTPDDNPKFPLVVMQKQKLGGNIRNSLTTKFKT